mmetsp:Transcript_8351/g.18051  ORF Transcript_8351/g.18051 Transcript_8351/m.18051 type:complete len:109 (+) Transcript_8351:151-477(+)
MGSSAPFAFSQKCARSAMHLKPMLCLATPSSILSKFTLPSPPFFVKAVSTKSGSANVLLRNDNDSIGITTLTLNNPKKFNVLSWEMLDTLQNQLDDIASNSVSLKYNC